MFEDLHGNQTLIISLDIDNAISERLKQVAEMGVSLVEINTSDTAILKQLISAFPKLHIGAGNVTCVQQLENCCRAGVRFISSPGFLRELAVTADIYSIILIPGVGTLSEAMEASNLGMQYVRPLPASPSFCNLLSKHLPHLRQIPDIEMEHTENFLTIPSVVAVRVCNPDCAVGLMA